MRLCVCVVCVCACGVCVVCVCVFGVCVKEGREYAIILKSFKNNGVRSGTQHFIFDKNEELVLLLCT